MLTMAEKQMTCVQNATSDIDTVVSAPRSNRGKCQCSRGSLSELQDSQVCVPSARSRGMGWEMTLSWQSCFVHLISFAALYKVNIYHKTIFKCSGMELFSISNIISNSVHITWSMKCTITRKHSLTGLT